MLITGVLLYVLRRYPYEEQAEAICNMRTHIRSKYQDIRMRNDIIRDLWSFVVSVLEQDATQENIEVPILKDGKERGCIRFDVNFYPVLKPEVDAGGKETLPDTSEYSTIFQYTNRSSDTLDLVQRLALYASQCTRRRISIRPSR